MVSTHAPDLTALGFRIVAALERYQAQWEELIDRWFDRECWLKVNAELDELRSLVAAVPEFSADLMQVIMRHAQLLRSLIKPSATGIKVAEVTALRHKLCAAIDGLRNKCLRVLGVH